MDEAEKFSVENLTEERDIKSENMSHHHSSSHHGSGGHHHSGRHHHSGKGRSHHDSQKKVVKSRMREVRWEKFFKPVLRVVFFVAFVALIVMLIWSIFSPNQQVRDASKRDPEITDKIQADIQIEELKAEVESLEAELDEYKDKIDELKERLAIAGVEDEDNSENSEDEEESKTDEE